MKQRLLILLTIITIAIPSLWGQVMIDGLSYKLNEETKQAKLTQIFVSIILIPKFVKPTLSTYLYGNVDYTWQTNK